MSSTECSMCVSGLEDQVTPCCFSCSAVFSLGKSFSSIAFKRKFFRGHYILEEPSPAKIDTHECHILGTEVDLYLAPANEHIAWKNYFKLLTISRQMSFKLLKLQIMFWFPSDPKFFKLKKQFKELQIMTSTYEGSYQPMVNTSASKYIRTGLTIKSQF